MSWTTRRPTSCSTWPAAASATSPRFAIRRRRRSIQSRPTTIDEEAPRTTRPGAAAAPPASRPGPRGGRPRARSALPDRLRRPRPRRPAGPDADRGGGDAAAGASARDPLSARRGDPGRPAGDATVLRRARADPDGAFGTLVGAYAAALDRGVDGRRPSSDITAAGDWSRRRRPTGVELAAGTSGSMSAGPSRRTSFTSRTTG